MTTYRLSCGHEFTADNVDHELRDRVICPDCPKSIRSNESRTLSWSVNRITYVVAVRP